MSGALLGGYVDERTHQGYSTWLSACRAAGPSLQSLFTFTLQLLPGAVIGFLAGGLVLQGLGFLMRRRSCLPQAALAAHAGCMAAMVAGLYLCTLAVPLPWMLAADALLAAACAAWLYGRSRSRAAATSVKLRTEMLASAQ
jgi:hypothetical protein